LRNHNREGLRASATTNGALPNRSRSQLIPHDKEVYKERHLVECFIYTIKRFRCIATRYEKTGTAYMAMFFLVGAVIWMH